MQPDFRSLVALADRRKLADLVRVFAQLGIVVPADTPYQSLERVLDRLLTAGHVALAARESEARRRIKRQLNHGGQRPVRQFSADTLAGKRADPPIKSSATRPLIFGPFDAPSVGPALAERFVDAQASPDGACPWLRKTR